MIMRLKQTKSTALFLALAPIIFAATGCSSAKKTDTPPAVTMTKDQLQQNIDQINNDATLSPQEKELKIQMLKTHMGIAPAPAKP